MVRLDQHIKENNIKKVSLIKIDVEGYEFPVLQGLQGFFETSNERQSIICEIHPSAYSLLGITIEYLTTYMKTYGYGIYNIHHLRPRIDAAKIKKEGMNVLLRVRAL